MPFLVPFVIPIGYATEISGILFIAITFVLRRYVKTRTKRYRRRVIKRKRNCFWRLNIESNDEEFRIRYRMSRQTFHELLDTIRPSISKYCAHEHEAELKAHISSSSLQAATKLGIFLRVMAGGSIHYLEMVYGVGKTTAYKAFDDCLFFMFRCAYFSFFS